MSCVCTELLRLSSSRSMSICVGTVSPSNVGCVCVGVEVPLSLEGGKGDAAIRKVDDVRLAGDRG